MKDSAYRLYSEERQARLRQERINMARKIAPGFLDNDDRRILTPTLATGQVNTSLSSNVQESASGRTVRHPEFDFSEFEQSNSATDIREKEQFKEEVPFASEQPRQRKQSDEQRGSSLSPNQDGRVEDVTEVTMPNGERIVQALPIEALSGMLLQSRSDDDTSTSPPRPWGTGLGSEVILSCPLAFPGLQALFLTNSSPGIL